MKTLTISIIILLAISSTLLAGGNKESTKEPENTMMVQDQQTQGTSTEPDNTMMMVQDQQTQDTSTEPFIDYQNMEQSQMIAAEAPTVLFFYATWCPTCRSAREEFNKRQDEFKNINIILVDYDNSKDLQKKYGVTYQHTFVQIDENGDAIVKWNGGATDKLLSTVELEDKS